VSEDLARLDAAAQAELVRIGEVSPEQLTAGGDRARRADQPGAQRDHPPPLRAGPGGVARRAARRSVPWRAVPLQGPRRRPRRAAAPHGDEGAQGGGLPAPGGYVPRRALPRGRSRHDRQDQHWIDLDVGADRLGQERNAQLARCRPASGRSPKGCGSARRPPAPWSGRCRAREGPRRAGDVIPASTSQPASRVRPNLLHATGNPAISLPLQTSDEGLPMGVQLIAPLGREDVLLRVAAQLEEAHPWADRFPEVFSVPSG
jgi:hypothetical protein